VTTDDEQARKGARWARYQAESRRTAAKVQLGLCVVWVVLAILWWAMGDGDSLVRWIYTGLGALAIVAACFHWRVLRRPLPPAPGKREAPGR
jgi:hypothetical protein